MDRIIFTGFPGIECAPFCENFDVDLEWFRRQQDAWICSSDISSFVMQCSFKDPQWGSCQYCRDVECKLCISLGF